MRMAVLGANAGQHPGAGVQVELVSPHAGHFADALASEQAKPKDALAVDLARQRRRQDMPKAPDFGIIQNAIAPARRRWRIHPGARIAIEVTPSHGPAQHRANIAKHAIGFYQSAPAHDLIEHTVDIAPVQVCEPHAADQGKDVLAQPALNLLRAAKVRPHVLGEIALDQRRHSHSAGLGCARVRPGLDGSLCLERQAARAGQGDGGKGTER
jgi:hypothetical protein